MTYPALKPTTREFVPPPYPFVVINTMSNRATRNLLASKPGQAQLNLSYENISDAQGQGFVAHYESCRGGITSFSLPANLLSGLGEECANYVNAVGSSLTWRWDQPPKIDFVKKGVCSVTVVLRAYIAPGALSAAAPAPVVSYTPAVVTDNTVYPSFSGTGILPPPPTQLQPGTKWLAYSNVNEVVVNSHSIVLDDDGFTYTCMANQVDTEVTRFSPVGAPLWTRKILATAGQQQWGAVGFPGIVVSQTIHDVGDGSFLVALNDRAGKFGLIRLEADGDVLYNQTFNLPGEPYLRMFSNDRQQFLTASTTVRVNVFDVATGSHIKRFRFSASGEGLTPWLIRSCIQKPNGNYVFIVSYEFPYVDIMIEVDSSLENVVKAVSLIDAGVGSIFVYRPEAGGYLFLQNNGGRVTHIDDSFQLIEAREFEGWPSSIRYGGNGDYYLWGSYVGVYQDLGLPGVFSKVGLVKYNWAGDYAHYTTETTGSGSGVTLNPGVQRISFTTMTIGINGGGSAPGPYRYVASCNLVQPGNANGLPITAEAPFGFSFAARSLIAPTRKPVPVTVNHTRIERSVSIIQESLPAVASSAFTVENSFRDYTTIS